jgi:hypothetical protein
MNTAFDILTFTILMLIILFFPNTSNNKIILKFNKLHNLNLINITSIEIQNYSNNNFEYEIQNNISCLSKNQILQKYIITFIVNTK